MSYADLDTVIEDAMNDAAIGQDSPVDDSDSSVGGDPSLEVEASPEGSEAPSGGILDEAPAADPVTEGTPQAQVDEFGKKFGLDATSVTGRENRIPYSRVKKITEKAVADKAKELETTYAPKIQEFEAKVKEYETRLSEVNQFEQIMANDPVKFIQMLDTLPAYKGIYARLTQEQTAQAVETPANPTTAYGADMPQPNRDAGDGTMVYDDAGLKDLLAWHEAQVAKKVTDQVIGQVQERFGPIESEWQAQRKIAELKPVVEAQVADARTWPLFTENENEIVEILQKYPKATLEQAYRHIVFPKMSADRNKMREDLLKELKGAPTSTSAPASPTRPAPRTSSGPRALEDIIAEAAGINRTA